MSRVTATILLASAAFGCTHNGYELASQGRGGWGWFLLVAMIFWGTVFNLVEDQKDQAKRRYEE